MSKEKSYLAAVMTPKFSELAQFSGRKLKDARKKAGFGRQRFGRLLRVTGQTVLNWERQIHDPGADMLVKIAAALDKRVEFFFEEPKIGAKDADHNHGSPGRAEDNQKED